MFFDLFILACITVFVIDLSGFNQTMEYYLNRWYISSSGRWYEPIADFFAENDFKPFLCSLCMTVWLCLLWMVICQDIALKYVFWGCMLAWLTPEIGQLLRVIKDLIFEVINYIERKFL